MRYFVVSDIHGYYSAMVQALNAAGFSPTDPSHMLIICGDLMDRGPEAYQVQSYVLRLMEQGKVRLVCGNHEDLTMDMLDNFAQYADHISFTHHYRNGTFKTMLDLTGADFFDAMTNNAAFVEQCRNTPYVKTLIPNACNFIETPRYVFVHGWVPTAIWPTLTVRPDWREASREDWALARWANGMEMAHKGAIVPGKTLVCGHWHCSWGWSHIKKEREEFPFLNTPGWEKSFEPYTDNGILAIDGCTAYSGIVNCVVIDD